MNNQSLLIGILKDQVVPALGCTEPTAVAYAVAKAKELLEDKVENVYIYVDPNIFKNGMKVGIPGTKEKGIAIAAALAIVMGKSKNELQVLKGVTYDNLQEAFKLIEKKNINLSLKENTEGLYIEVIAKGKSNTSKVIIKNTHLNIILLEKNGIKIFEKFSQEVKAKGNLRDEIKKFTIKDLINFVEDIEYKEISFINEGIVMNKKIAEIALKHNLGFGLANMFSKYNNNIEKYVKAVTTAAAEARMSGYPLPVMSSAGSGNHGLVTILPIAIIGEYKKYSIEKIVRAVTLSHLITIYIKSYTGSLSPICGCAVAAGVGASAGITYLFGGNLNQIQGAIRNMIAGVSGMICDGAKLGCAYKLCVSVSSAIDAANMALNDVFIPSDNGILDKSVEKTIENLGKVSTEGMKNVDEVILKIMMEKI